MQFLKSSIYIIGAAISSIVIMLLALLVSFLPFKQRYTMISQWARFCVWWLKITCGLGFKVIGKENIPTSPCVVMSNHQSTWDTLVFQTFLPPQTWVLKKELLFIPVFGWGLAMLKPIIINRGDKFKAIRKVIKQGSTRIKEGIWVIIYPEGTRQPYKKLGNYQTGGVAMAQKSNTLILPICHNAGKFWAKGKFIKTAGIITITIGKPINPQGLKPKEVSENLKQWTQENIK